MSAPGAAELPRVCLHVDDVGMCHGANAAFFRLRRQGRCDAGSVMVPCPWFGEAAEAAAADPTLDLGVHLTLTAEKRHYRWRPLTAGGQAGGLVDDDGMFWRSVPELRRHAHPEAAEAELRAQIDRAIASGMRPSHLDSHMGCALVPEFLELYVRLGRDYDLPILFPRTIGAYGPSHNFDGVDAAAHDRVAAALEAAGEILADAVLETPWHRSAPAIDRYRGLLAGIGPGFTFVALHPNAPGEIEAIEPSTAEIRKDEFALLADAEFGDRLNALPIRRIGMRELNEARNARRRPADALSASSLA